MTAKRVKHAVCAKRLEIERSGIIENVLHLLVDAYFWLKVQSRAQVCVSL